MGRLFGTDGARGVAITELTCELAMQIGRAAALVLTKKMSHKPTIYIGKDTRISSDILESALAAGICSVGANAELLGVVPTPAVATLVRTNGADAGVMISASHNSVEFNGIKLFSGTGYKLSDDIEEEIESLRYARRSDTLANGESLADCEYFRVERVQVTGEWGLPACAEMRHLLCLSGEGSLVVDGETYPIVKGDSYFLPPMSESTLTGNLTLLVSGV